MLDSSTITAIVIGVVMFVLAIPTTITAYLMIRAYQRSKQPRPAADIEASATTPSATQPSNNIYELHAIQQLPRSVTHDRENEEESVDGSAVTGEQSRTTHQKEEEASGERESESDLDLENN